MTEQGNKKKLGLIIGGIVLVALIVVLIFSLSSCGGNEDEPEATVEPTAAIDDKKDEVKDTKPSGTSTGSNSGTGSSGSNSGTAQGGSESSDRDKLDYILNYGDNVENGVESAADKFVGELEDIGKGYDKGDIDKIGNTAGDFMNGLGDFLGGIKDSVIP